MANIAILVAIILGIIVLFSFVTFKPKYADEYKVSVFNKMVITVVMLLCTIVFFQGRQSLPFSPGMKTVVAIFVSLGLELFLFGMFFFIRNFWIFKPPKRPGSGLF